MRIVTSEERRCVAACTSDRRGVGAAADGVALPRCLAPQRHAVTVLRHVEAMRRAAASRAAASARPTHFGRCFSSWVKFACRWFGFTRRFATACACVRVAAAGSARGAAPVGTGAMSHRELRLVSKAELKRIKQEVAKRRKRGEEVYTDDELDFQGYCTELPPEIADGGRSGMPPKASQQSSSSNSIAMLVPHVEQQEDWDCGLACVGMVLSALGLPLEATTQPRLRMRLSSSEVWTIDLAYLLSDFGVDAEYCTATCPDVAGYSSSSSTPVAPRGRRARPPPLRRGARRGRRREQADARRHRAVEPPDRRRVDADGTRRRAQALSRALRLLAARLAAAEQTAVRRRSGERPTAAAAAARAAATATGGTGAPRRRRRAEVLATTSSSSASTRRRAASSSATRRAPRRRTAPSSRSRRSAPRGARTAPTRTS